MDEPESSPTPFGDMTDAEFRQALRIMESWLIRYRGAVRRRPVLSRLGPGEIRRALPQSPPVDGEPAERWIEDLDRIILPGVTHWNHPGFLAYFGLTGSAPGILGEMACAALNVNGMLWKTSPACTELEETVLRWYAVAMGLPANWFGMMTDTASTSTLLALAAAREASGLSVRDDGLSGKPPLALYCSSEAHSSVDKAALLLGVGSNGIRRIPCDPEFRLRPDALEDAVKSDVAAGRRPFAVVATVGTTSTTSVDPVPRIAAVARKYDLWLHVDAAYAGTASIASEFRWALDGCDEADSLVSNPHKWLFTPIDCSALFTRRPEMFRNALSLTPEYLRSGTPGAVDYMDYNFQLGRRFRAIKLWFVFRYFGTAGIARRIREHVRLAQEFARRIDAHPQLERLAPAPFSVVCFRVRPSGIEDEKELDDFNTKVLESVNGSGRVFLSHTRVGGRYSLRLAVGNLGTTMEDLEVCLRLVCSAARIPAA